MNYKNRSIESIIDQDNGLDYIEKFDELDQFFNESEIEYLDEDEGL